MQLEFFWDAEGDARARCKGRGKVVAGFLESDLQDSTRAAHEVLRALDDVESGREESWELTGNTHTLSLTPEGATIVDEMDDEAEPYELSLAKLREVVADWASFLDEGRRT
ncbi:MAG: YacL family protein [Thermoanaerobaculia bacterium]